MRAIAANELIGENFASFTRGQLNRDGFIDIYLHTPGGAVTVGGGSFGSQTISSLPISAADQQFLQDIVPLLDQRLDAEFRFTSDKEISDIQLYYDSEIELDGDTLGLATTNNQAGRDWWELFINAPAFGADLNYLRYSLIHELGHALGLEHPFDNSDGDVVDGITDPWTSAYPEETVMAYRNPLAGSWPNAYSVNDLEALVSIWGAEMQLLGDGDDQITGENYSEAFNGRLGNDRIRGMSGNDKIRGGSGNDWMNGNKGSDWMNGNLGNDTLFGGRGDDTLRGGKGDDWLDGSQGNDRIFGDLGADVIKISTGYDRVVDFSTEEGDRLLLAHGNSVGVKQEGNDLIVQTSLGSLNLEGLDASSFDLGLHLSFG
ncbi:hypothetical protein [Prochlorococcus sp. MIT 1303]|uniref:hypothetical protein n=1 Tax=Prochlorococcus sp. MIT 1303 TaxID=1723647 RepID=UPI0018D34597|nr:hypothetical protein [Prochlorococcus sp. MIT 1303]